MFLTVYTSLEEKTRRCEKHMRVDRICFVCTLFSFFFFFFGKTKKAAKNRESLILQKSLIYQNKVPRMTRGKKHKAVDVWGVNYYTKVNKDL